MSDLEHLIDVVRDITEIQKKIEEDLREITRLLKERYGYIATLEIHPAEEKKDDAGKPED